MGKQGFQLEAAEACLLPFLFCPYPLCFQWGRGVEGEVTCSLLPIHSLTLTLGTDGGERLTHATSESQTLGSDRLWPKQPGCYSSVACTLDSSPSPRSCLQWNRSHSFTAVSSLLAHYCLLNFCKIQRIIGRSRSHNPGWHPSHRATLSLGIYLSWAFYSYLSRLSSWVKDALWPD